MKYISEKQVAILNNLPYCHYTKYGDGEHKKFESVKYINECAITIKSEYGNIDVTVDTVITEKWSIIIYGMDSYDDRIIITYVLGLPLTEVNLAINKLRGQS